MFNKLQYLWLNLFEIFTQTIFQPSLKKKIQKYFPSYYAEKLGHTYVRTDGHRQQQYPIWPWGQGVKTVGYNYSSIISTISWKKKMNKILNSHHVSPHVEHLRISYILSPHQLSPSGSAWGHAEKKKNRTIRKQTKTYRQSAQIMTTAINQFRIRVAHIDGLEQDCCISSALAMEILQSYSLSHRYVIINKLSILIKAF